MPRKKGAAEARSSANGGDAIASYKHPAKRKHIPPAGLEAQGVLKDAPKIRYEYNPHLPPALRSATAAGDADKLPELLATARQRALSADEAKQLADALRRHEPWLEWSGKREKPWFEVEPVALHMHERVSTQAILRVLARQDVQRDLFADPQLDYAKAVQFYQVDVDWTNRMILGDSLQVMASLARREDLAGRVQMIYLDPPYGIKFASNFQPQLGQRDVKDREQDLTREPEMVKAYRDTWTLGIHSYLAYLRDRLAMARELLADTGSIFVQISDENLHRVRCVMDEVFGTENLLGTIVVEKTSSASTDRLGAICDYLLWYARDGSKAKYRQLFTEKKLGQDGASQYVSAVSATTGDVRRLTSGELSGESALSDEWKVFAADNLTSQRPAQGADVREYEYNGQKFLPGKGTFKTDLSGLTMLNKAERLNPIGNSLMYRRLLTDFSVSPIANVWDDTKMTGFSDEKLYVVQTATKTIARCLLMTTDPGDLVLDPTCGSGTTAFVAEQWGRRWITCDTSRVALALARQRLMTARFPFYQLRELSAEDLQRNPKGTWLMSGAHASPRAVSGVAPETSLNQPKMAGQASGVTPDAAREDARAPQKMTFDCKTVPHITLKSIARNTSLDPIFAKHEPILAARLKELNTALKRVTPELRQKLAGKLAEKQKRDGKKAITEADRRRWELPKSEWREWEAPFDTDPDWPQPLRDALTAYRAAWRAKMDEVNACIAANAEMEELVDKPEEVKGVVRVAGPFTMEGVIAVEDGFDTPIAGAPDELETFDSVAADVRRLNSSAAESQSLVTSAATDIQNVEAHLDKILRLLKASGVDFPGNKNMKFSRLDPLTGASLIHAEGEWMNGDKKERRVAVTIGPEVGNLTSMQVEDVIRSANRKGYDDVVFAAFGFDATAQDTIESESHPKLRLHMALIRPDVAMGDLLKTQPGSQLFTVFSAPRVSGPDKQKDGQFTVAVEGMDVYDPVSNVLFPTDKERIAAWFLDSDYDGRTFCICQAFFPDKSKWDKLAKALGDKGVVNEDAFAALSGFASLPFPRPARLKKSDPWRVAVKVIDPRGNEGLRVLTIE
jgi:adenine-specific DNA-methyltransferase